MNSIEPITNDLIYASKVDEYTREAVEIYLQNIDIPEKNIHLNPTTIVVSESEINALKSYFSRTKNLTASKELNDLLYSERLKEELFFIKTDTELIGVCVADQEKKGSYRSNYWRFYAWQSPFPSGLWFTRNGLDLYWKTNWTYNTKKITLFSATGNISDEVLKLLKDSIQTSRKGLLRRNSFFILALILGCIFKDPIRRKVQGLYTNFMNI